MKAKWLFEENSTVLSRLREQAIEETMPHLNSLWIVSSDVTLTSIDLGPPYFTHCKDQQTIANEVKESGKMKKEKRNKWLKEEKNKKENQLN